MTRSFGFILIALAVSTAGLFACGGRDGGGSGFGDPQDGKDAGADSALPPPPSDSAAIVGTAWAPGNAPGMVPAGHEIPVSGALVSLVEAKPLAIPDHAYCEACMPESGVSVTTNHKGQFAINEVAPGDYWLVVKKGQFRIERPLTLAPKEVLVAPAELTTLPSIHNPDNGDWVPHIAIASGTYDALQDVFGKMGIGEVDAYYAYSLNAGSVAIDFYDNGGPDFGSLGTLTDLVSDLSKMLRYHVIFIPCAGQDNTAALENPAVLANIRDYVAAGGKLYVTDWSGEWHDNVFPAFVKLAAEPGEDDYGTSTVDTPASAYNAELGTWDTSVFGTADGELYSSLDAEATDPDLHEWLDGQDGPDAETGMPIKFDASHFSVIDNWNTIQAVNEVAVGTDENGDPKTNTPHVYLTGSNDYGDGKHPLAVTYEPAGCGRVLYSVYHTTDGAHEGLVPQERILLYLIMEIGVCHSDPVIL